MTEKIFISYAREDIQAADRLYGKLKSVGLSPWMDKYELLPGDWWESAIEAAIKECRYFVAILSMNSVGKEGHVQRELRSAIKRAELLPEGRRFIVPVRIEECNPPFKDLEKLHRVDLFLDYDRCLSEIIRLFQYNATERPALHYREKYRRTGAVVLIRTDGYGFIKPADHGSDLFFHAQELRDIQIDDLELGDTISFILAEGPKGCVATEVRRKGSDNKTTGNTRETEG